MKIIVFTTIFLIMISSVFAIDYFPNVMNKQGILRNSSGDLLNGTYNFNSTIYNVSNDKPLNSYAENIDVINGVWNFFIELSSFSFFKQGNVYENQSIDGINLGSNNFTVTPYSVVSLYANDSDYLGGVNASFYVNQTELDNAINNLNITTTTGNGTFNNHTDINISDSYVEKNLTFTAKSHMFMEGDTFVFNIK